MSTPSIVDYYDNTQNAYRIVWRLGSALGLHYGFWEQINPDIITLLRHTPLIQAVRRENKLLADWANISQGSHVLDAGCGIGGSSFYLALELGCSVVGITLCSQQVAKAKELANSHGPEIASRLEFEVRDYTKTGYAGKSFDHVWALESVCHSANKPAFCSEAYRLLREDGSLILADYFATQNSYSEIDQELLNTWLNGWAIQKIETRSAFEVLLRNAGFRHIEYIDATDMIRPSSRRLHLFYLFTTRILRPIVVNLLRLNLWGLDTEIEKHNIQAARCQYEALNKGFWRYGVFIAKK